MKLSALPVTVVKSAAGATNTPHGLTAFWIVSTDSSFQPIRWPKSPRI